ncbi:putative ferric-chelate reductase 1 [Clupea harengus]|uniref:Ferric-chelate reductase 1 n=1 Tax=Clupea harengus TaxID=7950 RepID=A0A6P3WCH4_CLUHA|nr:putative ferric-chelate reductase 1 [Clupea harengus]
MRIYPLLVLLACAPVLVLGYRSGLVTDSCDDMIPLHQGTNSSSSPPPYTITTDGTQYSEGDEITVSLRAESVPFEGFLLQAREVGGRSPVGSFSVLGAESRLLECAGLSNSAVSHLSGAKKNSIESKWRAPQSGQLKDIEFSVTFVQNYPNYWVGVKSPVVVFNTSISNPLPSLHPNEPVSSVGCGGSKVCFSRPQNCDPASSSDCYFMSVHEAPTDSSLKFEIYGASEGYISIGFSDDKQMGNDDIYICGKDSNSSIQVQHAYSTGRGAPTILPLENISHIKTSFVDGVISCTFVSKNTIAIQRNGVGSVYYIMFAYGLTSNGKLLYHRRSVFISEQKIDITRPQVVTKSQQPQIIKAHGALMLIAWMTTGSLGMLIARYLKAVTKGRGCLGKDLWFLAHVFLMVLSVAATIIAFILSFSHVKGWSGGSHPVLGCLVMILAFIQPLGAFFRCGPQHQWRFVFNWLHTMTAVAIKGLSVAAIFTGLYLVDSSQEGWMQKVMGGFVAWEALLFALLDLHMRWRQKDEDGVVFESVNIELILLTVFFLGNLAFLITLLIGIGMT